MSSRYRTPFKCSGQGCTVKKQCSKYTSKRLDPYQKTFSKPPGRDFNCPEFEADTEALTEARREGPKAPWKWYEYPIKKG